MSGGHNLCAQGAAVDGGFDISIMMIGDTKKYRTTNIAHAAASRAAKSANLCFM